MLGSVLGRAVASCASLSVLLVASASSAQPTAPPPSVSYEAPPDCGSQSEFEARVRGRTRSRTLEPTAEARPTRFEVSIRRDQERVFGTLTIHEASGDAKIREIEAASCSEAINGLALIAALTLDPSSTLKTEPEPAPESPPEPPPAPVRPSPPAPAPRPEVDHEPAKSKSSVFRMDGSMSALGASGVATENRAGLEGAFGFFSTAVVSSGSLVRFGVRTVQSDDVSTTQGDATLEWRALVLELCPALLPLGDTLWLSLCAASEFGELEGQGHNTDNERSETAPWIALGPKLLARWEVLSPLFLQVGGEAQFPLNRDRFLLADVEVYEIPAVTWRAQAGVGVRFW